MPVPREKLRAWFTPSIPISAGPNFFGGLPGLILELHSMDGAHHFVLDALCQRSADIVEWKIRLVKSVSRAQFRDYYQRLHKHPIQTFEANGQRVYPQDAQGNFPDESRSTLLDDPLQLPSTGVASTSHQADNPTSGRFLFLSWERHSERSYHNALYYSPIPHTRTRKGSNQYWSLV